MNVFPTAQELAATSLCAGLLFGLSSDSLLEHKPHVTDDMNIDIACAREPLGVLHHFSASGHEPYNVRISPTEIAGGECAELLDPNSLVHIGYVASGSVIDLDCINAETATAIGTSMRFADWRRGAVRLSAVALATLQDIHVAPCFAGSNHALKPVEIPRITPKEKKGSKYAPLPPRITSI